MPRSWLEIIVARYTKEVIERKSVNLFAKIHRIVDQPPNDLHKVLLFIDRRSDFPAIQDQKGFHCSMRDALVAISKRVIGA